MRVALDAMGGDHAPQEIVHGALRALEYDAELSVTLVGREDEIREHLPSPDPERLTIHPASQVIGSDESPAEALRKKRDSSIAHCFDLARRGQADAVVSAGDTGAVVGAATIIQRMLPGVRKAGIAVTIGTREKHCVVIDVGANIHCKPLHLLHYGMMASVYSERVLEHRSPRVALMNIGTEDSKGNQLVRETSDLFEHSPLNFIGHVEGNDLFGGAADVIVCEGFVGNVVLKVCEGLSEEMHNQFEAIIGAHVGDSNTGFGDMIRRFRKTTDYAEIGGAPLLGVNGNVLICHGRSDRRAIGNAVKLSAKFARARVLETITKGLETHQTT